MNLFPYMMYILPVLAAVELTTGVSLYGLHLRKVSGAITFAVQMQVIWLLVIILWYRRCCISNQGSVWLVLIQSVPR